MTKFLPGFVAYSLFLLSLSSGVCESRKPIVVWVGCVGSWWWAGVGWVCLGLCGWVVLVVVRVCCLFTNRERKKERERGRIKK